MRVVRADLYEISIPFNFVFSHAAAERGRSDNVVLRLLLDSGDVGYGECLARPYVTGESADEVCLRFQEQSLAALAGLRIAEKDAFIHFIRNVDNGLPAGARGCLVELALIDAFGKALGLTVAEMFDRPQYPDSRYSGVLGNVNRMVRGQFLRRMAAAGLQRVKVKVGFGARDKDAVRQSRAVLGPDVAIGLDANAAWSAKDAVAHIAELAEFDVDFVEQPTARDDRTGLAYVTRECNADIIADETVCTISDAEAAIRDNLCDGFNVRIGKVGGLARALAMHDLAVAHQLRYHIGALVGETGVLAAAGRHLALMTRPQAIEGSFGDLLLVEDITRPSVRFGRGGIGAKLDGFGLGVHVCQERIEKYQLSWRRYDL